MRYLFILLWAFGFSQVQAQSAFDIKMKELETKYAARRDSMDKREARQLEKLTAKKTELEERDAATNGADAAMLMTQLVSIYSKLQLQYEKAQEMVALGKQFKLDTSGSEKTCSNTQTLVQAAKTKILNTDTSLKAKQPAIYKQMVQVMKEIEAER